MAKGSGNFEGFGLKRLQSLPRTIDRHLTIPAQGPYVKTLTRLTVKHAVSLATKENWQRVDASYS